MHPYILEQMAQIRHRELEQEARRIHGGQPLPADRQRSARFTLKRLKRWWHGRPAARSAIRTTPSRN